MNTDIMVAHKNLLNTKVLFITLGTARVHQLIETNKIVSNCHKQPSNLFRKKLLTINEIVDSLRDTFLDIVKVNPNIKVKKNKKLSQLYTVLKK